MYGLFRCERCAENPGEGCSEGCLAGAQWAAELPDDPFAAEGWPVCRCCGDPADLLAPLAAPARPLRPAEPERDGLGTFAS